MYFIARLAVAAFLTITPIHTISIGSKHRHKTKHHKVHYQKRHVDVFTSFDLCMANHESGEPGSLSFDTIRWHITDPPYEGAYQWLPSTWISAGGTRYGTASSATPAEQTIIFNEYEPRNPSGWPEWERAACGA